MGYFDRLRKRARNENGWSGYSYTGTSAAGADLVSEDTWCVVYAADVFYQSEKERLNSLTVSTNFVNPLSSGNPCTVSCYLYTYDPTSNGSGNVNAPPAGFYSAVSQSFNASTVGHHVSFTFSTLDIRPSQVYFWFTSSVSYESFGSNSIYHYATGNYNSALGTGTKTPALTGSFTGGEGGGGGSGGVGLYKAVASGSYSAIYAQRDFSYTRAQYSASYTALSFTSAGEVEFSCQHSGGGDKFLQMRAYLTASNGLDAVSGTPTGTIMASAAGGDWCSFIFQVTSGQTYYLWTVIDYCGTDAVPLTLTVRPSGWNYTISDKGSSTNLSQSQRSFSMSMSAFQTGRMRLSFGYSGQVNISVSASGQAFSGLIFISQQPDIDSATGVPLEYECVCDMNYPSYFHVEKGRTYYFFAIYNGGSQAGSLSFTIIPPPVIWTQGGSAAYSMLNNNVSRGISLGTSRYYYIKASFAHTGVVKLSSRGTKLGDGQMWIYMGERDNFDSTLGVMTEYEYFYSAYGELDSGFSVLAGRTYHFYIRNSDENQSLTTTLDISPPPAQLPYIKELERYFIVEHDIVEYQATRYYCYNVNRLSYKYRGATVISVAKGQGQDGMTLHLRGYLCSGEGIDTQTGIPYGPIIASYTGEGQSFKLTAQVDNDTPYYLYIVSSEIYESLITELNISITSPPARYFSVTELGEYYAISNGLEYSANPGESGVLRLELSFDKSGIARVTALPTGGIYECLQAYVSHTPYLDGSTGAPFQQSVASAAGSVNSPGLSFSFPVQKSSTYYLFIRGGKLYDAARFDVSIHCQGATLNLYSQGKHHRAQPFLYHEEVWRAVMPMCRLGNSWHIGG